MSLRVLDSAADADGVRIESDFTIDAVHPFGYTDDKEEILSQRHDNPKHGAAGRFAGRAVGEDLREFFLQVLESVDVMLKQSQEACLARIGEGIDLQHESMERIEEVYHLVGRQPTGHHTKGGGSVFTKVGGSVFSHASPSHAGSVWSRPSCCMRPLTGSIATVKKTRSHKWEHREDPKQVNIHEPETTAKSSKDGCQGVETKHAEPILHEVEAVPSIPKLVETKVANSGRSSLDPPASLNPVGSMFSGDSALSSKVTGVVPAADSRTADDLEEKRPSQLSPRIDGRLSHLPIGHSTSSKVRKKKMMFAEEREEIENSTDIEAIVEAVDSSSAHGTGHLKIKKANLATEYIQRSKTMAGNRNAGYAVGLGESIPRTRMAKLVAHPSFDLLSGFLILLSTVVVGAETDYMAGHAGKTSKGFEDVRTVFFFLFGLELLMRILAQGRHFFGPADRAWNVFDTLMVTSSAVEFCVQFLDFGGAASTGRVLRILRIVRITRAMRIGRILRYARTFRQIAYSLQSSMGTLFWVMVMIFLVVYCFAICFCQAATDHLAEFIDEPLHKRDMVIFYGSVPDSLFSLYKAMTGGINWGEVIDPLHYIGWAYSSLFISFVSLTFFGVLNVVTAIFVDSALQSQQHYKDLLIQESLMKKQMYSEHLRDVFREIDHDKSGFINGDEMEFFLSDPQLNVYLESIDIFPNDARGLFRLLDVDDSGEVSIDEFCEGCLRLKGEAKAFDIHCLIYNFERTQRRIEDIVDYLNEMGGGFSLESPLGTQEFMS